MTLSSLDFLYGAEEVLLEVLRGRHDRKMVLKRLAIQSCRVHRAHDDAVGFKELAEEVEWSNVEVMGSGYNGSDEDSDEYESDDYYDYHPLYFY